jgi:hypothetical protein
MPDKTERTKIAEELEQLQFEETQERVHEMRMRKAGRVRRLESRNRNLLRGRAQDEARFKSCAHKKGGKGVENLSRGNDHNYAVVKHQLSHGPIIVICQRCWHVWEPPPVALNRRTASAAQKAEYKRLYDEYVEAINFPTDNVMSGTQLFVVTDNREAA